LAQSGLDDDVSGGVFFAEDCAVRAEKTLDFSVRLADGNFDGDDAAVVFSQYGFMQAVESVAGLRGDADGVGEKRLKRFECIEAADDVDFVEDKEDLFFAASDIGEDFVD